MLFQLWTLGVQRGGPDTLLLHMKQLSSLGLMPFTSPLLCHLFPLSHSLSVFPSLSGSTAVMLYIKQIVNTMPSPPVSPIIQRVGTFLLPTVPFTNVMVLLDVHFFLPVFCLSETTVICTLLIYFTMFYFEMAICFFASWLAMSSSAWSPSLPNC